MVDQVVEARRQALRDHTRIDMENQDQLDSRDGLTETPQEMHERMLVEDAGEETMDLLEALREAQGGELVTWKVWRVAGPEGEPLPAGPSAYCGELGNSQLTMENLAKRYGAGKYRVKGRFSNGKIAGGRTITIDRAAAPESDMSNIQTAAPAFNMGEWLAMQAQMEEKREQREAERRDRESARNKELLSIISPSIAGVVTALIQRAPQAPPDLAALITALRPTGEGKSSMKETLETMMLMKKVMGDGGHDDSLTSIISAVAPHIGPALPAIAAGLASRQQAAPVQPKVVAPGSQPTMQVKVRETPIEVPAPTVSAPARPAANPITHAGVNLDAPSDPNTMGQHEMFAQVKPQVDQLVIMASQGADPVQTADVFFDNVMMAMDDTMYNSICNFLGNENAVSQLTIFNTGVAQHKDFFVAFQQRALERINAESEAAGNG